MKIDNLLNINKRRREGFLIIASETIDEIDFRVSPYFELIDPVKKVSEQEEYDFMVINEGVSNNDYENYSTNININLVDLHCNNNLTRLSIKKMIQEFNYPDEIADTLEEENELLNALYNNDSFDSNGSDIEFDSDEEMNNFLENTETQTDSTETQTDSTETQTDSTETEAQINSTETDISENIRNIKSVQNELFMGFDFQLTRNEDNELFITDIVDKGIADSKLYFGDKIIKIDNLDIGTMSYKDLIKYMCSK